MKCQLCGYEFEIEEVTKNCKACPLSRACKKTCCPNCGYEIPLEPGIITYFKKRGE